MSFYFPSGNSGWLLYLQCSCVATIQIALVTDELTKYVTMNCRTLKSLTLQTYSLLIVDHLHVYIDLVNLLEGCIKLWSPVALHWQEGKMSNLSQLFFYTVKLLNNGHPFCKASVTSIEGFQCIFFIFLPYIRTKFQIFAGLENACFCNSSFSVTFPYFGKPCCWPWYWQQLKTNKYDHMHLHVYIIYNGT